VFDLVEKKSSDVPPRRRLAVVVMVVYVRVREFDTDRSGRGWKVVLTTHFAGLRRREEERRDGLM